MLYVDFDGFLYLLVKCVYGLPSVLLMATSVIWEIVVVVFFPLLLSWADGDLDTSYLSCSGNWVLFLLFSFFFFFSNHVNPSILFFFSFDMFLCFTGSVSC